MLLKGCFPVTIYIVMSMRNYITCLIMSMRIYITCLINTFRQNYENRPVLERRKCRSSLWAVVHTPIKYEKRVNEAVKVFWQQAYRMPPRNPAP